MNRKKFIESHGATCKNWNWSWSFINQNEKVIIFGAWDIYDDGYMALILSEDWSISRRGNKQPGYPQSREHIRLIEEEGYGLKIFRMEYAPADQDDEGAPAKIKGFTPELKERSLVRIGNSWYALDQALKFRFPEEVYQKQIFWEGASKTITVNQYERSHEARKKCLGHHGYKCSVCGFDFEETYGEIGKNYIHVHHVIPFSEIKQEYKLDPLSDLIPICPNCHAMIHITRPALNIEQLKHEMTKHIRETVSPDLAISKHDLIKAAIFSSCNDLGFQATQEYRGKDWRADVYVASDSKKFAFEIQMSSQSLKRTLERQDKYIRDGVIGCWLFEKAPSKLSEERPDLPLFYVIEQDDKSFSVSLSGRKDLELKDFLHNFLIGKIQFCDVARTAREQKVKLIFYEMECWKCKAMNHIYYVEPCFRAACNAAIHSDESLWGSDKNAHRPEIIALALEFVRSEEGKHIKLGEIKRRFSKTVQNSYMSFGCYSCDSIFGDWFVMEAELEVVNGHGQIATIERSIDLDETIELNIPHWCYPGKLPFCDSTQSQIAD